jgi:hypothetical protein
MSQHLSLDAVARYSNRELPPADLIAADDHLAVCEVCRRRVSDPGLLNAVFRSLRQDLDSDANEVSGHLTYEQMEAFAGEDLDQVEREIVESHIEDCRMCSDELTDLQAFHNSQADDVAANVAFVQPRSLKDTVRDASSNRSAGEFGGFWRWPKVLVPVTVAALVVLVFSTRYLLHQPFLTTRNQMTSGSTLGSAAPSAPEPEQLRTPPELAALIGKQGTMLGASREAPSFTLRSPVGTFVEETRPTFRWQSLSGAREYKVTVFNAQLNLIETSPQLHSTEWKSSIPLKRRQVYLWQVTATRDLEQVVSPVPPAAEAKFKIISEAQATELNELKRDGGQSHYALGLAYARAGVLDQAEQELTLVPDSDPAHAPAQKYLAQLHALRHQ